MNNSFFSGPLSENDPQVMAGISGELLRQRDQIEMIASENIVSRAVLEAVGSALTNKYAEGYPGNRYYGGCQFVDEAESGRTAARPAFREMIALARTKHPPFDAILVWKLSRFARSRIDSITYKKLLKDRGIKVISMNEPLDDTPSVRMLEGVIETMDQFYSENMGEDTKRGLRESAQRGFYTGSKPPYGLHKVPAKDGNKTRYKLAPDAEDSTAVRVVRRIYDMALKDMGCKEIAKVLNSEGLRTGTGQFWGRTTVHKVLTNEAYCGILVLGGRPGHPALHSGIPPVRVRTPGPLSLTGTSFFRYRRRWPARNPRLPIRVLSQAPSCSADSSSVHAVMP